jgi:4-hydroxybenzoate polyprenyltransferase
MLRIIRPKNLLLMALLQCLVLLRLGDNNYLFYDLQKTILLILSTVLIAAGGYIINDYFDVKIDLVNKPDRVIVGMGLSRRLAIILHISMTSLGLLAAYFVNVKTLGIAIFSSVLLYIYSASLKKRFLIGNMTIALLAALSIFICQAYIGELNMIKVITYSIFSAVTTLIREIIKDLEDEKGDALFQSSTLAINLGLRRTKLILISLSLLLMAAVIIYPIIALGIIYENNFYYLTYVFILISGIALPLVFFIFKLVRSDRQQDFAQLSGRMKLIMLIVILSILFS